MWGQPTILLLFCVCKELWVDRVQLTKMKKNTKYLLERSGGMNGALLGHYISCQYYLKRDIVIIVELQSMQEEPIYHCAACKLNICFDWKRNHFRKWHSAACDHFRMYTQTFLPLKSTFYNYHWSLWDELVGLLLVSLGRVTKFLLC